MLNDNLVEDVRSLEEEMPSMSLKSSKTSSSDSSSCEAGLNRTKLNGKEESGDLLQLARDNIILAVSKKASRHVADDLNKYHMILQNRFRFHISKVILPQLIATSPSTSCTAAEIPVITMDYKKFVDEWEKILGPNNQIPTQKVHFEARAIQSFMVNVDMVLQTKGFNAETIAGVKKRILDLQKQFIYYLSTTDADSRIEKLMSLESN